MSFLISEERLFKDGNIDDIVEARKWYSLALSEQTPPWSIRMGISVFNSIPEIMIRIEYSPSKNFEYYFNRVKAKKRPIFYYLEMCINNLKKYYSMGMDTIGATREGGDTYLINHSQLKEVLRLHLESMENMKIFFKESQEKAEAYNAQKKLDETKLQREGISKGWSQKLKKEQDDDVIGQRLITDDENEDLVGSLKDLSNPLQVKQPEDEAQRREDLRRLRGPVSALAAPVSTLPGGSLDDRPPDTKETPKKEPTSWFPRFYGGRNICSKRKNKRKTKGKRRFYETRKYKIGS